MFVFLFREPQKNRCQDARGRLVPESVLAGFLDRANRGGQVLRNTHGVRIILSENVEGVISGIRKAQPLESPVQLSPGVNNMNGRTETRNPGHSCAGGDGGVLALGIDHKGAAGKIAQQRRDDDAGALSGAGPGYDQAMIFRGRADGRALIPLEGHMLGARCA